MKKLNVTVKSKSGLHARPAATLVNLTQQFESNITIEKDGRSANAKSIIGILSIGAAMGDMVSVLIDGEDETEAFNELEELFNKTLPNE
ncbi:phosphotransferase system, HPr-related protein [Clostridium argentinense CDC 2741]|uniref:Phosphocarrier protein HPr n=1 Tax=Clostridium argentinense CDC 2741 TaxID=1418104 RepID=A0A0C1UJA9_9CLOT|nr:HPr family phosphocarrier protein [Clostridium argentinense]HCQ88839.1 HPr family phosphocarrier protein [Clostridium sp.]ARC85422.1 phosphocarrier protein HPr [Clostridium argentinense]KIE47360.1 phosphotransferase system, HPr-related protein [Clostridium argentinense CDC 2741]NFF41283.1 HPr family phosphocarrier protein [Clostridium argentinense]NFP52240.1 HPr family phosphocarrier protein [Clostridium argentinense]